MNSNTKLTINSKIIKNIVDSSINTILIIGKNNDYLLNKLKNKHIDEFTEDYENKILDFLNELNDEKYDIIILNIELYKFKNINLIINLLLDKGLYSIIQFKNNKKEFFKQTKISNIIKSEKASIIKKFYVNNKIVLNNILFKPFSKYIAYLITKNKLAINLELSLIDKIKKTILFNNREEKLLINKK